MDYDERIELKSDRFKTWLVMGKEYNWETALTQPLPIWGLKDRYFGEFARLNVGDYLIFYVVSPVTGIIGLGKVKDKYVDRQNLVWEDEKKQGRVVWPLRFRIEVVHLLTKNLWRNKSGELSPVAISDLNIMWRIGFQELSAEYASKIFNRIQEKWGVGLGKGANLLTSSIISENLANYETQEQKLEVTPAIKEHNRIQNIIAEAGRLQHYFTELEYPLENRRLDVVWKREMQGVPTFAYEIELSGGIEKALMKLRLAFKLWNSRPLLILPKEEHPKVESLIQNEERIFKENVHFYEPKILEELLAKKRDLRTFEEKLRIY
jgi:hypothetical protein